MDEKEFKKKTDQALRVLKGALVGASDDYGFQVNLRADALEISFEHPPAKIAVAPNAPARQLWITAGVRSYKLDFDIVENAFMLTESGQTLIQLIEQLLSRQTKTDVTL